MKKYIILLLLAEVSFFSACTEDRSEYLNSDNFIKISGIAEEYKVVSFSEEKLQIKPSVESSFPESDMTYFWTYYNTKNAEIEKTDKKGRKYYISPDTIGRDKDLDFLVKLGDGEYTLVFTAKSKSTGYFQQYVAKLQTQSSLSHGFYILKENEDGDTDVDLFKYTDNKLISDVIMTSQGKALRGKPRALDINHQLAYIDPNTDEKSGTNMLCITTEQDQVYWIRALDGKTVKDFSNFYYEQVSNIKPYRVVRGTYSEFLFTDQGIFNGYTAKYGNGLLGEIAGYGSSRHVVQATKAQNYYLVYWSLPEHDIKMLNYRGQLFDIEKNAGEKEIQYETTNLKNLECLYAGLNFAETSSAKAYFLFENNLNHQKLLYEILCQKDKAVLNNVKVIEPTSHYAKASLRAICAKSATIAYAVDQNKIYSYSLAGLANEKELKFQGLPANEKITFLSNRYFLHETASFDYLIVGTQTGNTYKLYFYEVTGGEPAGAPKYTTSGKGILKSLGYVDPTVADMEDGAIAPVLDE
ncbi:hypothetical protein HMPREF1254_0434 [Prevotella sp. BV3P1]|uniref:PKD-like family lipoprotein n=1 Tax=Prevotella sp. BV3P1 TaxID=1111130 RepID=UPI0003B81845|nr:PKD-like family lipoprotein [Prevotella sp. BV3P1]ERT60996.1 hypothetical protein HMPREF1254_0434 [Prevotella sp. BV3P1]